jgi:hypothetical protein
MITKSHTGGTRRLIAGLDLLEPPAGRGSWLQRHPEEKVEHEGSQQWISVWKAAPRS